MSAPVLAPARPPETPAESSVQRPELLDYLALLAMRKWVVAGVLVLVLGSTALYSFARQPLYQARATLIIAPTANKVLSNVTEVAQLGSMDDSKQYYETQYNILTSYTLLEEVARRTHLSDDLDFLGIDKKLPPDLIKAHQEAINPTEILRAAVQVDPVKNSQLVNILVLDPNPERASIIANMVGDVYRERNLAQRLEASQDAEAWLDVKMKDLLEKLRSSEEALDEFKRANDILSVSLSDRQNILAVELETSNRALSETRIKRMQLEAQAQATREAATKLDGRLAVPSVLANPGVQRLLDRLATLREELSEAAARYESMHPEYHRVQSRLDAVKRELQQRIDSILAGLEEERRAAASLEAQIQNSLAATKKHALELNRVELDYGRLRRDYDTNKSLHDMVLSRLKETSLTGGLDTNNASFLDRARVPGNPVIPNIPLNLTLALLLGLVGGIGLALFLAFADDTVKSHEDIEQRLKLPYLGMVPTLRSAQRGIGNWLLRRSGPEIEDPDLYVYKHPGSQLAESCRAIRSNLVFMSPDKPIRRLAVTSAEAGAGKTATAVKLAILMAQTQGKTLLVDADMRRSRLHTVFKLPNDQGLSTVIAGQTSLSDAIKSTEVPKVDVLTSARTPPNPAELLHSEQFQRVVEELSRRYNLVIFDTPPLLNVTDAVILGRYVDGVVLIARWGKTKQQALKRVTEQLRDVQVPVFGVVLNDMDVERRAYTYYYRIYGGYSRYSYGANPPNPQ